MPSPDTASKPVPRRRPSALLVVAAALLLAFAWALTEPHLLTVERSVLTSPDLPADFNGTRVVFAADIHAGPTFSAKRVRSLVNRINAENPDLVILGGDYVGGHNNGAASFYPEIAGLRAPEGVVAVLGNHDFWEGRDVAVSGLKAAGITLLDNANARIRRGDESIRIAGVDDELTGQPDVVAAAGDIAPADFAILVSHVPDYLDVALPVSADTFDLALSGHTHGGQITAFGLWAPVLPSRFGQRYRGGWLAEEDVPVLVTRGVATVGPTHGQLSRTGLSSSLAEGVALFSLPLRFFAPPQIHVIELKRGPVAVTH